MSFVLIKALSTFLYPIFSSILAIAGGLALRRFRKKTAFGLVVFGLAYLYLCSTYSFSNWLAKTIERDYGFIDIADVPQSDAIVVLGGGVSRSGSLLHLSDSADRVLYGARLLRAGKAPLVVVSNGVGYGGIPQSKAMCEFLKDLGVDEAKIVEEAQALNTYQHTVYLKPIFEERGIRSIILVTSAWHMRRSFDVFDSQMEGCRIFLYPVDTLRGKTHSIVDFLPSSRALDRSSRIIKEYVGYILYDIKGWIR